VISHIVAKVVAVAVDESIERALINIASFGNLANTHVAAGDGITDQTDEAY